MRELHLFAGIGGGILGGILLGHETVCAVEIDPYCRRVIRQRQIEACLPEFPLLEDVRQFDGTAWRGKVDIVCGGFPCQPWSQAGKRKGADDPRHLWPEMARIISECRPKFVFAENVSLAAFAEPWRDLRGMGYRVPPALCLGASHVGAPHRRIRWWLLAADADRSWMHESDSAQHEPWTGRGAPTIGSDGGDGQVANADRTRLAQREGERGDDEPRLAPAVGGGVGNADGARQLQSQGGQRHQRGWVANPGWWQAEPPLGRVADGVPDRVGQLRALGNAQVPQVAAAAFSELMGRL